MLITHTQTNMITLKTLEKATAQEVFDQVVKHLLNQKKRSLKVSCAYRGDEGLKCAAGCLIADDEYSEKMEGTSWLDLVDELNLTKKHANLINALQDIHDYAYPDNWEIALKNLTKKYKLNWNF